ncbi:hypothetical protein BpHYR1_015704 [Brachionus plicatilis]|uniref:Uncharacterized protein n=1 Tax=Brachionus plicatilis TaxID=10195 RepID=A0A3M7RFK5_BRAPC|nr:hypothetical protein BpHYR1_015704 [Brachionus plicatilis]
MSKTSPILIHPYKKNPSLVQKIQNTVLVLDITKLVSGGFNYWKRIKKSNISVPCLMKFYISLKYLDKISACLFTSSLTTVKLENHETKSRLSMHNKAA